jgi:thiamine-phosphate diphosphorylase/hydroxyethylthiazole kinase
MSLKKPSKVASQYRDKNADTAVMITTALKLHRITRQYRIPLLVNGRVDVALAAGAEGVHLGQDDMHISDARKSFVRKPSLV